MPAPPNVRLKLSSRPENVVFVRETLSGLAESVGLDQGDLHDLRTAVTEACNNVVLHAYDGGEGPLEVEVALTAIGLEVLVRDRGAGIRPTAFDADGSLFGIGLTVVQALVHGLELRDANEQGTEVRMRLLTPQGPPGEWPALEPIELPSIESAAAHSTSLQIAFAPVRLARAVLPRLLSVFAARAHFSTDRVDDVRLLAGELLTLLPGSLELADQLGLAVSVESHELSLRIGPLIPGYTGALLERAHLDGIGSTLARLADGHQIAADADGEVLTVRLTARPGG